MARGRPLLQSDCADLGGFHGQLGYGCASLDPSPRLQGAGDAGQDSALDEPASGSDDGGRVDPGLGKLLSGDADPGMFATASWQMRA